MKSFSALALSVVLLSSVGCGGGGSGSQSAPTAPVSGSQTLKVGDATITFTGKATPQVAVGVNGVTVTGMAGAAFSSIITNPAQYLSNTELAVSMAGGALYILNPNAQGSVSGSTLINLQYTAYPYFFAASFSHLGLLGFLGEDSTNSGDSFGYLNYDGTGLRELTPISAYSNDLSWSPVTAEIAYSKPGVGIGMINTEGTGYTTIVSDSTAVSPSFSNDGKSVVYSANSNGYNSIYIKAISGGSPTVIEALNGTNYTTPSWSADGKLIVLRGSSSTADALYILNPQGSQIGLISPPSGYTYQNPTFSPDGKFIACEQILTSSGTSSLTILDLSGNVISRNSGFAGTVDEISWSPFYASKTFVGTSGAQFPSAAGFIYSQNGSSLASLASFTVNTPTSATVTAENSTGGSLVYDVHGDAITGIKYTNAYYSIENSITAGGTDALISFDGTTGQVDSVIPFTAVRGSKPRITSVGKSTVITGQLNSVWDGKGKNVAPSGATKVTITAGKVALG